MNNELRGPWQLKLNSYSRFNITNTCELEKEHGKLIWSFDSATPKNQNITEVQVDAKTGKIVSTHVETPAMQAKEAQSEK